MHICKMYTNEAFCSEQPLDFAVRKKLFKPLFEVDPGCDQVAQFWVGLLWFFFCSPHKLRRSFRAELIVQELILLAESACAGVSS